MSGEATRRRNQRKGGPSAPPPPKIAPSRSYQDSHPRNGSGCCVKVLFFLLLSTAALVSVAIYTDYQTGQLREAYIQSVPAEYRDSIDHGVDALQRNCNWALEEGQKALLKAKKSLRGSLKEINCGKATCDQFLFGVDEDQKEAKLKAEKEAKLKAEKVAKLNAEKEAKQKAELDAKLKAEKEAKLKAEQEAKKKAEQEAKKRAEQEAKKRAEQEAKKKAEQEAKKKAEQEAKLKAEKEAKLKAEQEAKYKAEQEAKLKAEHEAKLKTEQEAKLKAEQEAKRKAEQEAKKKAEQEAKKKAEQEAKLKAEKEAKLKVEQEAKLKLEKNAKIQAEKESSRNQGAKVKSNVHEKGQKAINDPSEIRTKISESESSQQDNLAEKRRLEKERLDKEIQGNSKGSKSEKDRNEALDAAKKAAKLNAEKDPQMFKRLITNAEDAHIQDLLDSADSMLDYDPQGALLKFEEILEEMNLSSPRALYGKALALKKIAEIQKSNPKLESSIGALQTLLAMGDLVPDTLFKLGGEEAVRLLKFRGWNSKAVSAIKLLTRRFPQEISFQKELGVLYLIKGQNEAALKVFEKVLEISPEDGFSLVHLGFVHKILAKSDKDLEIAVAFLKRGISSRAEGVMEGNFFFHLGDALSRLNRKDEADLIYQEGSDLGIFKSFWQRSLYNLDHLKSKPIWTPEETKAGDELEKIRSQWKQIRDEILKVRNKSELFQGETENLLDSGLWKQFEIYRQGLKVKKNCQSTPFTCSLFEHFPPARTNTRGQIKFSVMSDKTHVHAHSGPTNTRLRIHLPLVVPSSANASNLRLRVTDQFLTWKEGELLIFDDSFDHEVWNNSGGERLILIFDIWHPDITPQEVASLQPI